MKYEVYAKEKTATKYEYIYTFNTEHEAYEEKRLLRQYGMDAKIVVTRRSN